MSSTIHKYYGMVGKDYEVPFDPLLSAQGDTSGYYCFIGANNSGKSSVLRSIGGRLAQDNENLIYIPSERTGFDEISGSSNSGHTLDSARSSFLALVNDGQILPSVWFNYSKTLHHAFLAKRDGQQKTELERQLKDLFDVSIVSQNAEWRNDEHHINILGEGSGLKSIFQICAALTSVDIDTIIIDEPELSLEASLQKKLHDALNLLSESKRVIVATHSPLFLNRSTPENNFNVTIEDQTPKIVPVKDTKQLFKVMSEKFGVELNDSFLPDAIVVIEGASDEVLVKEYVRLAGIAKNIFYHRHGLDTNMTEEAKNLKTHLGVYTRGTTNFYPYENKVFVLTDYLDQNIPTQKKVHDELESNFPHKWAQINDDSDTGKDILYAIPDSAYQKVGKNRITELKRIYSLPKKKRGKEKTDLANVLVSQLEISHISATNLSGIKELVGFLKTI